MERFWSKVDRSGGPDACWPWMGGRRAKGYGLFWLDGRGRNANRVAYELDRGHPPPPERPFVLHHCDDPPCCNPKHLYSGTAAENTADAKLKGRLAHRLTEKDVHEIRRRAASGESMRALGRTFNVSKSTISLIVLRRTWAHIS